MNEIEKQIKNSIERIDINEDLFKRLENRLEESYNIQPKHNKSPFVLSIFKYVAPLALILVIATYGFSLFQKEDEGGIASPRVKTFQQRLAMLTNSPETPIFFYGIPVNKVHAMTLNKDVNDCYTTCTTVQKLEKSIQYMESLYSYKIEYTYIENGKEMAVSNLYTSDFAKNQMKTSEDSSSGSKEKTQEIKLGGTYYSREFDYTDNRWLTWEVGRDEGSDSYLYETLSYRVNNSEDSWFPNSLLNFDLNEYEISERFEDDNSVNTVIELKKDNDIFRVTVNPGLAITKIVIDNTFTYKELDEDAYPDDYDPEIETEKEDIVTQTIFSYSNFEKSFSIFPPKMMVPFTLKAKDALNEAIKQVKESNHEIDSYTVRYKDSDIEEGRIVYGRRTAQNLSRSGESISQYSATTKDKSTDIIIIGNKKYIRENGGKWSESVTDIGDRLGISRQELLQPLLNSNHETDLKDLKLEYGPIETVKVLTFSIVQIDLEYKFSISVNSHNEIVNIYYETYRNNEYKRTVEASYFNYDFYFDVTNPIDNSLASISEQCYDLGYELNNKFLLTIVHTKNVPAIIEQNKEDTCIAVIEYEGYRLFIQRDDSINPKHIYLFEPTSLDDIEHTDYKELENGIVRYRYDLHLEKGKFKYALKSGPNLVRPIEKIFNWDVTIIPPMEGTSKELEVEVLEVFDEIVKNIDFIVLVD